MSRVKNDFLITILTVLIPIIMQLYFIRYISYNVDKTVYGNFILLQTLIIALSYIFIQIPSQAYTRFYNTVIDKVKYVNEFRTILIVVNIISFFIVIIYGIFVDKFSYFELLFMLIYFIILNNFTFNQKIFLLNLERKKFFILKIVESSAKFTMPIILYYYYETLLSFIVGLTLGYLISFLFLLKYMKEYKFKIEYNIDNLKKYFIFAYPIVFASIFSWGITFSDRYFIEYMRSTEEVAIYAILTQVAGMGQVLGQIYFMYVEPKVLKEFEINRNNAIRYLKLSLVILFIMFTCLFAIAYILPVNIYTLLIEKSVLENNEYLISFYISIIAVLFSLLQTAFAQHFVLYKKLKVLAYINFLGFVINLIGNFYIAEYGILAAAVSTMIAYASLLIFQIIYIRYIFKLNKEIIHE